MLSANYRGIIGLAGGRIGGSTRQQAELGLPVADLIRKIGISERTFYHWKKQYVGLGTDQVREFKQLTDENARLKKLVAELSLDKALLRDALSKKFHGQRS